MPKEGDIRQKYIGEEWVGSEKYIGEKWIEIEKEPPIASLEISYKTSFEKGKTYQTRGGWPALVIWISQSPFGKGTMWAIHELGKDCESVPIAHDLSDGKAMTVFAVNEAPSYTGHPADILLPEKGGEEPIQNPE